MWKKQKPLVFCCAFMLCLFVVNCIGLIVDPRLITGSPAWLKPAKFSISVALYTGTLAWILNQVNIWPTFTRWMATLTVATVSIEIAIIDLQAWRGTTSHFNFRTSLDGALFGIMGVSIAVLWLASVGIAAALFRQKFSNASLGWALRLGMLITVLGSASGGMMTRPMPGQTSSVIGAHTVGAPDGGPGIPGTGWSASHGDLRIAHFVGLHGMQAVPLLYWLISRRRPAKPVTVALLAASYLGAAGLLEWQALRGQSILQPDAVTLYAWLFWILFTLGSLAISAALSRTRFRQLSAGMA